MHQGFGIRQLRHLRPRSAMSAKRRFRTDTGVAVAQIAATVEGRAEWVKPTPLLTFNVGPLNGREAPESGLRRTRRCANALFSGGDRAQNRPVCSRARDVAAFLRTGAVSLSIVVSGERLSQTANRLQLLVFDHCHASGRCVSRVANRMP